MDSIQYICGCGCTFVGEWWLFVVFAIAIRFSNYSWYLFIQIAFYENCFTIHAVTTNAYDKKSS